MVVAKGPWAVRNGAYFTVFAAGVLVTTGLTLLPEALAATAYAPFAALGGYLLLYGVNLGAGGASRGGTMGAAAPAAAIGLHSFVDGIEYGVLFEHDVRTGVVASAGLVAHELAEGVILYALLRGAGLRLWPAAWLAFAASAVTTPAGAVASQPVLAALDASGIGLLLSAAAGGLLYVGATHLPLHLREEGAAGRGALLVVTYLVGVGLSLSLAVGHAAGAVR